MKGRHMKWFTNLSIKLKLLLSFGFITLIAAAIGLLGIFNLSTLREKDSLMYNNMTVPITYLADITNYYQRIRVNTRDLILAQSPQEEIEYENRIIDYRLKIAGLKDKFEKTILLDNVRNSFSRFKEKFEQYNSGVDKLIQLVKQNQNSTAIALLRGEMYKTAKEAQEELDKLIQQKNQNAGATYLSNDSLSKTSSLVMSILLALGVLSALTLSFYVSKLISSGIKEISGRIDSLKTICLSNLKNGSDQLSKGDLNINIKAGTIPMEVKSEDEVGKLAENVNQIIVLLQETISSVEGAAGIIKNMIAETKDLVTASLNGNLSLRSDASKFEGGYREIIEGLNANLDAILDPFSEAGEVLKEMSNGNFTKQMKGNYKGDYKLLKDSINTVILSLNQALYEVSQAVHATASASTQISSSSEEMAAGAQEQSQQTSEIAGAIEQMTGTIFETTKNTGLAAEASNKAGEIAKEGGHIIEETIVGMNKIAEVVSHAADTVAELGKNSDQIGEIVQVIDDIADQTNLLALNAAIEAARAGEQGRGFAVVADEVRKLAERTTKATKEIAAMIRKIQTDTTYAVESIRQGTIEVEKGRDLAKRSGSSLNEIIQSTNSVVDIVNQVAAASEEQSSAAEQISKNIEGISSVTNQSAAGVQQIARAAEDLNRLTLNLQELTGRFRISKGSDSEIHAGNLSHRRETSRYITA